MAASGSVPSTPNMGRRKLELLPRTANQSTATSPIGSPKASTPTAILSRANPFGDAKPVDATSREKEVEEKLAKERETRVREKSSNDNSPRTVPHDSRLPPRTPVETGSWRDKKPTAPASNSPAATSRPVSAAHSRTTSHDGRSAPASPKTGPVKKQQAHFSFAAIATDEIPVVEGEEDDGNTLVEDPLVKEVEVKLPELAV